MAGNDPSVPSPEEVRVPVKPLSAVAIVVVAVSLLVVSGSAASAGLGVPRYGHVFLLIDENHNYSSIIGNPAAPEINALAADYGLATRYTGVADPSEPNYVAMLGGSTFGISSDDPYFFPGHTVDQPNLMSQLEAAGLTWKGYFQGMPYSGYRGYCFPAKCNGIPDSDTQYVAKHNGLVNFVNMQTPAEFAKMTPYGQLSADLASGNVPNLSYIVPDECHDMHGAPPWCLDSGHIGGPSDTWLVATGDGFVGSTVTAITSAPVWQSGNNAIVVTFDEGNMVNSQIATIVITNHGPRGLVDNSSYDHYSLLATVEQAFGLGCLQASCSATTMAPLFQTSGPSTTPALPAPFTPPPDGSDSVSATGNPVKGAPVTVSGSGWQVVPSPSIGNLDNNLAAVSAGSANDAWAVGNFYNANNKETLNALGLHWDGHSWTAFPLPNVGPNENTLLGVSELPSGRTWAVGYFVNAEYQQRTLVEHYDGVSWQVVPSPSPDPGNILYGVAALSDSDVWAVGGHQDATGIWHPLAEHWNGTTWSVVPTADPNGGENLFYGVTTLSAKSVYATGQTGTAFPGQALVEHWNGKTWTAASTVSSPGQSLVPFAVTGSDTALSIVGERETDTTPFSTLVAGGPPSALSLLDAPSIGSGENDLFAATTAADGTNWGAGWNIDPASGRFVTLVEHGIGGSWTLSPSPSPGTSDDGLAGITAIPGGGLWAVGDTTSNGAPAALIEYHP
jgi:hypothetical protein